MVNIASPPRACPLFSSLRTTRQSGRAKAEASAAAAASAGADEDRSKPATIPLTSGRALAVGYLQALIDPARAPGGGGDTGGGEGGASGREGEVTSALHDELAYLLMEGLLVRFWASTSERVRRQRLHPLTDSKTAMTWLLTDAKFLRF